MEISLIWFIILLAWAIAGLISVTLFIYIMIKAYRSGEFLKKINARMKK